MKVLMLFNDYLQAGGERVSVGTEVRALQQAGVDVSLLSMENSNLSSANAVGKVAATFPNRDIARRVTDEIARFKPNIIHAQNLFPQLGAGAIDAIRESGKPWVRSLRNYRKGCIAGTLVRKGAPCSDCSGALYNFPGIVHGCYQNSRAASVGATNYALWDSRAEKRHPPLAYILISEAMRQNIGWALDDRPSIHISHNAVEAHASDDGISRGMKDRSFDVAFIGRLTMEKGVKIALEMAIMEPSQHFAFAGRGPLAEEVSFAARNSENVSYFPDLDQARAFRLMQNSRVVAVPSMWEEPFGRVAAEALAAGALPLVSKLGGLPEVVNGLPYGPVVPSNSAKAWSTAATGLVARDSLELENLSAAAHQRWKRQFSPDALAQRLIAIYEQYGSGGGI